MQHLHTLNDLHLGSAWITIGSFDGVHRGHQSLINQLVAGAHHNGAPVVVVTFFPHPAVVLRGIQSPFYLTHPDERAALLGDLGVDYVVTLHFDHAMAQQTAQEFMAALSAQTGLKQLWVGQDFALGRNRQGDVHQLTAIGQLLGYELHLVSLVPENEDIISSSRVRKLIQSGDVERAATYLGRLYDVSGEVIHGDERGRTLGFPTANLDFWPQRLLPANGVYATWLWLDGRRLPSVTNVGTRPTFKEEPVQPNVEAYVLDFDQDIYGRQVRLEFVRQLRPELRYDDVQALIDQMYLDMDQTREVLKHAD
ncbi:MAG: bifunctional riboflavin kinase/FAD synthetase [Chloroflexi bacterium]|nr:bifunctional riboflavin kinase/FAD synthetase [Anaerolineaceae bacterium]NMB91036.1 bifunctional riboflavin kinase/FAD synthetase [Chloroflexota bacterium]